MIDRPDPVVNQHRSWIKSSDNVADTNRIEFSRCNRASDVCGRYFAYATLMSSNQTLPGP